MYLYIAILVFFLLLGIVEIWSENKRISWVIGIILALFAGFRYYTGYDYETYREFYYEIQSIPAMLENSAFEPGYLLLNYSSIKLGIEFPTFVLVFSLVSLGLLTWYLYKYFPYPSIALTYYYARFYHLRDMAQVRSGLASVIVLFAIPYILEKKFWKFLAIILFASMFHGGSLIFLFVYFLHVLIERLDVKSIIVLIGLAIIAGLLIQYPEWYEWLVPERYISYIIAPSRMGGPWYTNSVIYMQLMIFGAGFMILNFKSEKENAYMDLLLKIYLLASLALIASNTLRVLGGRVSTFLATVEILIVPYLILNFTKNKLLNLLGFILFTSFIFYLVFIFSGRFLPYIPYRTIFTS